MKILKAAAVLGLFAAFPVLADEPVTDKAADTANDAKRSVKKGAHRTAEALCTGTKAECAKQKVSNRVDEGKDAVGDKATELKHKTE